MGAMSGTGLWLIWVVVAGGVLSPVVNRIQSSVSATLAIVIGSLLLAVILMPAAVIFARIGGTVAGRMTNVSYMRRVGFYLSLMLDGFLAAIGIMLAVINAPTAA